MNLGLITVDLRDRKQLYEQLIDNIKGLILTGDLTEGEKLPSVRSLSRELGINPNTIQKAYNLLERNGVIVTLPGRGSVVSASRLELLGDQSARLIEKMSGLAADSLRTGMEKQDFMAAAEAAWEKAGGRPYDKN